MVYTTQGEMLQGYLIVRVCDRCARARCVCTIDRADLRELYSVLSDPCAKNSYTRTRQPLCCAALRVALERLSGCTTTMFDESIPFLSAENALSAEQPKLRHAKTKRKKKPRASQKRTGYRPTESSKVKRARSCRACSVALRWQGAANIYTQHMHAVHGHGRRAAAARRTARVARAARDASILWVRAKGRLSPHAPSSAGHMRGAVGCHLRACTARTGERAGSE